HLMQTGHEGSGAMASLGCSAKDAADLLARTPGTLVIANINSPTQTVVSGDSKAIDAVAALAAECNVQCRRLPVSHAFHSPLIARAAEAFERAMAPLPTPASLSPPIISGVESADIDAKTDLRRHLGQQ